MPAGEATPATCGGPRRERPPACADSPPKPPPPAPAPPGSSSARECVGGGGGAATAQPAWVEWPKWEAGPPAEEEEESKEERREVRGEREAEGTPSRSLAFLPDRPRLDFSDRRFQALPLFPVASQQAGGPTPGVGERSFAAERRPVGVPCPLSSPRREGESRLRAPPSTTLAPSVIPLSPVGDSNRLPPGGYSMPDGSMALPDGVTLRRRGVPSRKVEPRRAPNAAPPAGAPLPPPPVGDRSRPPPPPGVLYGSAPAPPGPPRRRSPVRGVKRRGVNSIDEERRGRNENDTGER